jgi:hypothetical protein
VKFGSDSSVMDALTARMYLLDEQGKIQSEHVRFLVT